MTKEQFQEALAKNLINGNSHKRNMTMDPKMISKTSQPLPV